MNGAKETVSNTLSHVMVRTRGVVQESVEKTRMVVTGGVHTMMESKMAKLVSSGVDSALRTSENLVEHYLPAPADTQGKSASCFWIMNPGAVTFYNNNDLSSLFLLKEAYKK